MGIKSLLLRHLFNKPIIIIEIGNDWLKILECNPLSQADSITKTSFMKLSQIKESVSGAISKVFRDLKLNKNTVILCIPRHLATVRILELPSIDPKEIADMIDLQIGKQTPYAKEEIVFSHRIIDAEREGYTKAMLVIAKHSLIKERLVTLEKVGIDARRVCLSSEGVIIGLVVLSYHAYRAIIPKPLSSLMLIPIIPILSWCIKEVLFYKKHLNRRKQSHR
jgi:Tfp pilus assembly PilM family ATPase